MSKYVNVKVSTVLSTDFYLEVPENSTEEEIKKLAEQEIILPNDYPEYLENYLFKLGVNVKGLNSLVKSWDSSELKFEIN